MATTQAVLPPSPVCQLCLRNRGLNSYTRCCTSTVRNRKRLPSSWGRSSNAAARERHVGSELPTQGSNPHPSIGRRSLNHWTTREVLLLIRFKAAPWGAANSHPASMSDKPKV